MPSEGAGSGATQEGTPKDRDALVAAALLLLVGLAAFVFQAVRAWPFVADDAFITFRYAANWVHGHGPVWNAGGPRAEGYSSFGFLSLCLVPEILGTDPVVFARAIGVGCALSAAALAGRVAADLAASSSTRRGWASLPGVAAAFAAGSVLAWFPFAVHAVSGMETLLAAALLTGLVCLHTRLPGRARARGAAVGVLSLALGLVRPELNVVAGALLLPSLARLEPQRRRRLLGGVAACWLLPGAAFLVARGLYYGHALPLPFYAKLVGGPALPGLGSVLGFAQALLGLVALPGAIQVAAAPRAAGPVLLAVLGVAVLGLLPDPVMDFEFRYCVPAAPAAFALAGAGLSRLVGLARGAADMAGPSRFRWLATSLALVAALAAAAQTARPAALAIRERHAYGLALASMNVRFGMALARYADETGHRPLVALGDVGAIGYHSGARVIDTFSLNDPEIVLSGRDDPGYVLDQAPDLVALVSTAPREFRAHWANRHDPGLYSACVGEGRRPAVILTFSAASYLWVMTRPGSGIETWLRHHYLGPPAARDLPARAPADPGAAPASRAPLVAR